MSATAALHPSIGHHWVKRLARRIGVPTPTARDWIYRGIPDHRLPLIAAAILAECDEIERLVAATRQQWGESNEAIGVVAREQADEAGAATRRVGKQMRGK